MRRVPTDLSGGRGCFDDGYASDYQSLPHTRSEANFSQRAPHRARHADARTSGMSGSPSDSALSNRSHGFSGSRGSRRGIVVGGSHQPERTDNGGTPRKDRSKRAMQDPPVETEWVYKT
jgi:hypothetical protein